MGNLYFAKIKTIWGEDKNEVVQRDKKLGKVIGFTIFFNQLYGQLF